MEALLQAVKNFNSLDLRISIEAEYCDTNENALCLHLYGEIDNETSRPFEKVIGNLFTEEYIPAVFILECSQLQYVSSTGIGSFVNILMQSNHQNVHLYLSSLPDNVRSVFALLGFSRYFNFIDSPAEAFNQNH